jgi:hypothetical protein
MNSQPFIDALGKTLDMELSLSPQGELAFVVDGRGLLLQWREASQDYVLYAEVGPLAGWRDGEICRLLLSANFLLAETQGATLSYDSIANMVGINYIVPIYGMQAEDFVRVVNNVVELADVWKEKLTQLIAEQEALVTAAQDTALQQITATEASALESSTDMAQSMLRV